MEKENKVKKPWNRFWSTYEQILGAFFYEKVKLTQTKERKKQVELAFTKYIKLYSSFKTSGHCQARNEKVQYY